MLQLEEAAQEVELGLGELRHVGAILAAGQQRADGNDQHLQHVVTPGIAAAGIVPVREAGGEPLHGSSPRSVNLRVEAIRSPPASQLKPPSSGNPNAIPLLISR